MRATLAAPIALFAGAAVACNCGGSVAGQLCQEETSAICQRVWACYPASEQADAGFLALYGTGESDCESKIGVKCAGVTDKTPCGGATSQTYNSQTAQQCLTSTQQATCAQIQDPTFRPQGCDQACQ